MRKKRDRKIRRERKRRPQTRIERDIRGFIGWDYIEDVSKLSEDPINIAGLFLTGCRATEYLELTRGHFSDMGSYYQATNVPVFKRYDILNKYVDEHGKRRWETELIEEFRSFAILKTEPLAETFWENIRDCPRESKLFHKPQVNNQYWQLYKLVHDIDPPYSPLAPMDEYGEQRRLYPHWFRGQRAAQLRVEYNLDINRLMEFFRWEGPDTALHYARLSVGDMAYAMMSGKRFMEIADKMLRET